MPAAIGQFLAFVGTAIFTGLTAAGLSPAAALFILDVGVKLAGLALLGSLSRKLIDLPDLNDSARNNLVTVRGTLEHQRIIYGEALFSGPLWYMNTAGQFNQSLYHAVVVAGHEIEDITDVWLDDEIIPEASIDWAVNGSVDSGWLAGDTSLQTTAYFDKFLGTDNQTASPDLITAFSEITSQHQGRNIAWFLTRLDYFDGQTDVWSGGVPRNFKALVKGKKVYNPNSDSSQSWGTGPHRVNSSDTWEWSDDPALCWADYMIDARLGFGEDAARIDYAYVASVYSINRTIVFTPVGTDFRFRCNGGLSTRNTYQSNLEAILSAGNMTMALIQGTWRLRGWEFETPTLSFGDDELRKDISIQLSTEEIRRYNSVRAVFVDKDRRYQPHSSPSFTSSEYIARDDGRVLFKDIQLPLTTDIFQAQRLSAGVLEQSDLQRVIIYPSNFKTLPVEIGGTIKFSNAKMNWVDDTFRVTNYKINDMQGIDLVLQEDNSAAYSQVGTAEYTVNSGGVYVRNDPGVPPPSSFYISNVPNGIMANWTNPPARLFEYTELYRNSVRSFDNSLLINKSRINGYLDKDLNAGQHYYWIRSENFQGEFSDRVPDAAGVDSGGLEGQYLIKTQLIQDASFELTPINTPQSEINGARFWGNVGTGTTIGGRTSGFIKSEDVGTGGTHHLHLERISDTNTGGIGSAPYGIDWFPIVQGLNLHVHMRWRVPVYAGDTNSAFLDLPFRAERSFRDGTGETVREIRLAITNSTDWQVYSANLDNATLSNVLSYSIMRFGMQINAFTGVNTGEVHIDVDDIYVAFVP